GVAASIEGFHEAYLDNRNDAIERGIAGDFLAEQLKRLATSASEPWEGTATELLARLNAQLHFSEIPKWWPKNPQALSGKLRRGLPGLKHIGVEVHMDWSIGRGKERRSGIQIWRRDAA